MNRWTIPFFFCALFVWFRQCGLSQGDVLATLFVFKSVAVFKWLRAVGMKGCGTSPKCYTAKYLDAKSHRGIKKISDLRQLQCDSSALRNNFQPMQWCSFTGIGLGSRRDLSGTTTCVVVQWSWPLTKSEGRVGGPVATWALSRPLASQAGEQPWT